MRMTWGAAPFTGLLSEDIASNSSEGPCVAGLRVGFCVCRRFLHKAGTVQ